MMVANAILKCNRTKLKMFILLAFFFPLQSITLFGKDNDFILGLYNIIAITRCVIACYFTVCYLGHLSKLEKSVVGIIVYEISVFLCCCVNGSITFRFTVTNCISMIGFALMCHSLVHKHGEKFIDAAIIFFGVLAIVGCLSTFCFPNGFNGAVQKKDAIYFLGSKNSVFNYFMPFIFFSACKNMHDSFKIPNSLFYLCFMFAASTIITNSAGGLVNALLILIIMGIVKYTNHLRYLLKPSIIIACLLIFAVMIPALTNGKFDFVFDALGRESNFSNRTYIWESAMNMINEHPIFGNGKDGDLVFFGGQTHTHNFYLDVLAKYGVLSFACFVIAIIQYFRIIKKKYNKMYLFLASGFVFVLLFHSIFEALGINLLFIILFTSEIVEVSKGKNDVYSALKRYATNNNRITNSVKNIGYNKHN